jgi:HEPN domain-containing protein
VPPDTSVPPAAPEKAEPEKAEPEKAEPEKAEIDPAHWLYRLTAEQWLSAADNELKGAYQALAGKQQRAGVTYARRAAGMALNARLRRTPDPAYGRSYMEHLQALRTDAAVSQELRGAASRLLAVPTTQQLVTLGPKGDTTPAELAGRIIEHVRAYLGRRGD